MQLNKAVGCCGNSQVLGCIKKAMSQQCAVSLFLNEVNTSFDIQYQLSIQDKLCCKSNHIPVKPTADMEGILILIVDDCFKMVGR